MDSAYTSFPFQLKGFESFTPMGLLASGVALAMWPVAAYAVHSYRGFKALGPGGVPSNVRGWLEQAVTAKLFANRDLLSTGAYSSPDNVRDYGPHARTSFLPGRAPLSARAGPRPEVPGYLVPQRQTTDAATPEMRRRMVAMMRQVAARNPDVIEFGTSGIERHGPALFLKNGVRTSGVVATAKAAAGIMPEPAAGDQEIPSFMYIVKAEIVHLHVTEGSSHMTLSLADAEDTIDKKWAQRHGLSGKKGWMPLSYMLVYAPRDDDELEQWARLLVAACRFVSGGRNVAM